MTCAVPFALPAAAQNRRGGLKLFMNCDIEGSSGIFTREQAWYWENGVREHVALEARELFTADINMASAAALEAGATPLVGCGKHPGGGDLPEGGVMNGPRA